jgi:acylphosphatase
VKVVVHGRVQGVFFRATCARRAEALGVDGWVRNRSDGTVEAVFAGPGGPVGAMLDWCRQGPDLARVEDLELTEGVEDPGPGFRIGA